MAAGSSRENEKAAWHREMEEMEREYKRRTNQQQAHFNARFPPPQNVGYPVGGPNLEEGKVYYMKKKLPINMERRYGYSSYRVDPPSYLRMVRTRTKKADKNHNGIDKVWVDFNAANSPFNKYPSNVSWYYQEPWRRWGYADKRHPEWKNKEEYFTVMGMNYNTSLPVHRPHAAASKIQGAWRRKTAKRNLFNRAARPPGTYGPENTGGELYKLWKRKFQETHGIGNGPGMNAPAPSSGFNRAKWDANHPEYAQKYREWEERIKSASSTRRRR